MASTEQDPCSAVEAKSAHNKDEWKKAMEREIKSLHSNEVWELVGFSSERLMPMEPWNNTSSGGYRILFRGFQIRKCVRSVREKFANHAHFPLNHAHSRHSPDLSIFENDAMVSHTKFLSRPTYFI